MKYTLVTYSLWSALFLPNSTLAYFSSYTQLPNNSIEIADWTAPTTMFMYGSRTISETITNGSFADSGAGWEMRGDVIFHDGLAVIGSNEGSMLSENTLSQTLSNTSKNLVFEYQIFSTENLPGFDDPCFEARLNNKVILVVDCTDIEGSTGWQRFAFELTDVTDSQLVLDFSAGNTGDPQRQSWAEIRKVTTYEIVGNDEQRFSLRTNEGNSRSFFQDCEQTMIQITQTFSLDNSEHCEFSFWSEDIGDNKEQSNLVAAEISGDHPKELSTLLITHEPTGEYSITVPNMQAYLHTFDIFVNGSSSQYVRAGNQFFINNPLLPNPSFMIRAHDRFYNLHTFLEG